MAWRPTKYLKEGELDNTTPGKVTGWMQFAGKSERVTVELEGDFHRDIRGAKIRFKGQGQDDDPEAASYMDMLSAHQTGRVGDMTAGLPPRDYASYPYLEWYGDDNGRVVLELEPWQIEVIGTPLPYEQQEPVSRTQQARNMEGFLCDIAQGMAAANEQASSGRARAHRNGRGRSKARAKVPGMKLLTKELRRKLPALGSQDGIGGKAIAYAKFFTPDSSPWTWYITEFDGKDLLFGLVDGQEKELGYISLSELESVRGPLGLPVERDLHWQPKTLEEIAPEMFKAETEAVAER
jgi:hypothetical protein